MLLRRHHEQPDPAPEPDNEPDPEPDDAPQADKPAGRSRTRKTMEG
ncbi:hypothetical protein [Streptomyces griseoloalbus]|uniref:Uncharacterized protein n=1 Tax=Streptomyces griseoloalbus TaxID=67303 RepID=A0A7W8F9S9_9ACTN|nr:hypothetical protein [Streptomyces albaduncus]MBB5128448.1 hypothetical protein [Streptomyces albaduncus]GGW67948.1 hypothetical protein GCM10010340_52590 [Streptomyces albaduncus]